MSHCPMKKQTTLMQKYPKTEKIIVFLNFYNVIMSTRMYNFGVVFLFIEAHMIYMGLPKSDL